ncbi:MAG: hypothetical protein Q7K16_02015 [Candidatus Azambacteria bacterium]|nr:hypothetical protein [Candidatus Azambacteria bacterium]
MTNNRRTFYIFLLLFTVTLTTASCASSQLSKNSPSPELELKKLIGVWEGSVSSPSGGGWSRPDRVLVISEFGEQLYARYGLTRERLFRVSLEASVVSGRASVFFRSSANGRVNLTLVRDNWLLGHLTVTDSGSYNLSLVKVEQ